MKNKLTKHMTSALTGIVLFLGVFASTVKAQDVGGRISFGFDAGGNKYWGNYSDSRFGLQGDLFIRWNIIDALSLHLAYNAGVLGYKATDASIANENAEFPTSPGSPGILGTVNHIRVGGWQLMASYNVFPDETFVPYVIGGVELLNFEPDDATPSPLKGNAIHAYSKNVVGGVLGLGYEMFISPKVTFNGKVMLHLTGTDWIDDYSNSTNFRQDVFLTFGAGFSYYIFAPTQQPTTEVVTPPPTVTNVTNNYTTTNTTTNIIKTDTVVVTETDTVYKTKILKGTIYNFPGTLFIVNTDQFNTAMPGNMQNLQNIKSLVNQCPELKVEIQGHASHEGPLARNQELSDMRARKIQRWLIDQGVDPNKIVGVVGLGVSDDAVHEPQNATAAQLEAARILNRRMSIKVVEGCH
jgi:outer membrane protein OmpA-like peptidoglycan-associated protein